MVLAGTWIPRACFVLRREGVDAVAPTLEQLLADGALRAALAVYQRRAQNAVLGLLFVFSWLASLISGGMFFCLFFP